MSLQVLIPTFRTPRLTLRAPRAEDFPAFAAFLSSQRARFVNGPVTCPSRIAHAFGHISGLWVLRGYGMFVLERRDTGEPIGHAGAWHPMHWPERELAWGLWSAGAEGRGFMTEAMRRLHAWAFETLGWETCVSYVDARNTRSAAVARRLGAELDADAPRPEEDEPETVQVWRHRKEGGAQ
jgi:RimJ/RimL family protein N-acetyltransferase